MMIIRKVIAKHIVAGVIAGSTIGGTLYGTEKLEIEKQKKEIFRNNFADLQTIKMFEKSLPREKNYILERSIESGGFVLGRTEWVALRTIYNKNEISFMPPYIDFGTPTLVGEKIKEKFDGNPKLEGEIMVFMSLIHTNNDIYSQTSFVAHVENDIKTNEKIKENELRVRNNPFKASLIGFFSGLVITFVGFFFEKLGKGKKQTEEKEAVENDERPSLAQEHRSQIDISINDSEPPKNTSSNSPAKISSVPPSGTQKKAGDSNQRITSYEKEQKIQREKAEQVILELFGSEDAFAIITVLKDRLFTARIISDINNRDWKSMVNMLNQSKKQFEIMGHNFEGIKKTIDALLN